MNPIRALLKRVNFVCADVESIDLAAKKVHVVHGERRHSHDIAYDYLLIALGSSTNFFGLPGVEELSLTMKSLGDAIVLRNRLVGRLEEAEAEPESSSVEELLTFVVGGGGFAGIETMGAINDFLRSSVKFYPRLREEMIRLIVAHPGDVVLPELGPELGHYAQEKLSKRGVEIRTKTRVTGVSDDGVSLSDGSVIKARTLIWTAGTAPHALISHLPCKLEHGRIAVDTSFQVPDWPGVFALGDCAAVPDPHTGKPHPPTAQHAVREAKVAARNIVADLRGEPKREFDFKLIGQLAAIGHRTGVAMIFGFKFSGFIAWWMWRTIYLAKLPGFERKIRVAIDWTLDLVFTVNLVQYMSVSAPTVSRDDHTGGQPAAGPPANHDGEPGGRPMPSVRTESKAPVATPVV